MSRKFAFKLRRASPTIRTTRSPELLSLSTSAFSLIEIRPREADEEEKPFVRTDHVVQLFIEDEKVATPPIHFSLAYSA